MTDHLTKSSSSHYGLAGCPLSNGIDAFLPMLTSETELLTDYLSDDTIVCLIEPQWLKRDASHMHEQMQELYQEKLDESYFVVPPDKLLVPVETLSAEIEKYPIISSSLASTHEISDDKLVPLPFRDEAACLTIW